MRVEISLHHETLSVTIQSRSCRRQEQHHEKCILRARVFAVTLAGRWIIRKFTKYAKLFRQQWRRRRWRWRQIANQYASRRRICIRDYRHQLTKTLSCQFRARCKFARVIKSRCPKCEIRRQTTAIADWLKCDRRMSFESVQANSSLFLSFSLFSLSFLVERLASFLIPCLRSRLLAPAKQRDAIV